MKHLLILILMVFCSARAAIPPLPVSVDPTNSTLVWPTNLWTANVAGLTNALDGLLGGGSGSDTNWNGNPIASGTVTNLAVPGKLVIGTNQLQSSLTNYFRSILLGKPAVNWANGDFWTDLHGGNSALALAPLVGSAIASGSIVGSLGFGNTAGWELRANAANANSGYNALTGATAYDGVPDGALGWFIFRCNATNESRNSFGFSDSSSASDPTDAARLMVDEGYVYGRATAASVSSQTLTSNQINQTDWYNGIVYTEPTTCTFLLLSSSGSLLWSDSVTNNIPGSSQFTGFGFTVLRTTTNSSTSRARIDALGLFYTKESTR